MSGPNSNPTQPASGGMPSSNQFQSVNVIPGQTGSPVSQGMTSKAPAATAPSAPTGPAAAPPAAPTGFGPFAASRHDRLGIMPANSTVPDNFRGTTDSRIGALEEFLKGRV